MAFLLYAFGASLCWGVSYAVSEQLLRKISVAAVMVTTSTATLAFALCLGLVGNSFAQDFDTLKKTSGAFPLVAISIVVYVAANCFILLSTKSKNATMAAMVEITYPLFTALFAWLFFRQVQVTAGTLLGAGLILAGVSCIYYFGKNI